MCILKCSLLCYECDEFSQDFCIIKRTAYSLLTNMHTIRFMFKLCILYSIPFVPYLLTRIYRGTSNKPLFY